MGEVSRRDGEGDVAKNGAPISKFAQTRRGDSRIARIRDKLYTNARILKSPPPRRAGACSRRIRDRCKISVPIFKNCANPSLPPRGRWHFRKKMTEGVSVLIRLSIVKNHPSLVARTPPPDYVGSPLAEGAYFSTPHRFLKIIAIL